MLLPSDWNPRRVVITGYDDGPTEGVIDFGDDVGVYCFKAVAFDDERGTRVLTLARVPAEHLEALLTNMSSALGPPKWPFWVPMWSFSDETARRTTEAALDAFCAAGETVAAALTDDTLEQCFAIRKLDPQWASDVSDWPSYFA